MISKTGDCCRANLKPLLLRPAPAVAELQGWRRGPVRLRPAASLDTVGLGPARRFYPRVCASRASASRLRLRLRVSVAFSVSMSPCLSMSRCRCISVSPCPLSLLFVSLSFLTRGISCCSRRARVTYVHGRRQPTALSRSGTIFFRQAEVRTARQEVSDHFRESARALAVASSSRPFTHSCAWLSRRRSLGLSSLNVLSTYLGPCASCLRGHAPPLFLSRLLRVQSQVYQR